MLERHHGGTDDNMSHVVERSSFSSTTDPLSQTLAERAKLAHETQAQYGRWLLASILLTHGAAITLLASNDEVRSSLAPFGYVPNAIGIVFGFISGFAAWINWSRAGDALDQMQMTLAIHGRYDDHPLRDRTINEAYNASVAFGAVSVAILPFVALYASL